MGQLHLVRHGQASFGAENYDQLSKLGYQQSRWLGEYYRERGVRFDRLLTGSMERHRQTAQSLLEGLGQDAEPEIHDGFNEFDFQALLDSYLHHNPALAPPDSADARQVYALLRGAIAAWSRDELSWHLPESWDQFTGRVAAAIAHASAGSQHQEVLVVSSGGAISMALRQVLRCDTENQIRLNMHCRNTSVSQLYVGKTGLHLTGFNHVPHLDLPDRLDAITLY